jgi:hypothetical protein
MNSTSKDILELVINLIPQSGCFQSNGQCSTDKVGQQQILGVCTSIWEITVSRCTLISARGLHVQQVSCKIGLCNRVVLSVLVLFMNCLPVTSLLYRYGCALFTSYLCCFIVMWYNHELAKEVGSLYHSFWCLCILCGKGENQFWALRVIGTVEIVASGLNAEGWGSMFCLKCW